MKTYLLRKTVEEILFAMKDFFLRGKTILKEILPAKNGLFVKESGERRTGFCFQRSTLCGKSSLISYTTCLYCQLEGASHLNRIAAHGNRRIHQTCRSTHFHGFCRMTGSTDASIHHDRNASLFNDDLNEVTRAQT